jgi:hypothetical protein
MKRNEAGMPLFPLVDTDAISAKDLEGLLTEFLSAIWSMCLQSILFCTSDPPSDFSVSSIVPVPSLDVNIVEEHPSHFIHLSRFPPVPSLSCIGNRQKTFSLGDFFLECAVGGKDFHFRSGPEIQFALEQATVDAKADMLQTQAQSPPPEPDRPSSPAAPLPAVAHLVETPPVNSGAATGSQKLPVPDLDVEIQQREVAGTHKLLDTASNLGSQDDVTPAEGPASPKWDADLGGIGADAQLGNDGESKPDAPQAATPPIVLTVSELATTLAIGTEAVPPLAPKDLGILNAPITRGRKRKVAPEPTPQDENTDPAAPPVENEMIAPLAKRQRPQRAVATLSKPAVPAPATKATAEEPPAAITKKATKAAGAAAKKAVKAADAEAKKAAKSAGPRGKKGK